MTSPVGATHRKMTPNTKPIEPGLIAQLTGKLRQTFDVWFGPSAPVPQIAPPSNPLRTFDYPVGVNIQFTPRSDEPVTFQQMRSMADNYYLLRIVIETVKDRICARPWHLRLKPGPGEHTQRTAERSRQDDRVKRLTDFFRSPDREHTWQKWLRSLLEDLLVIDAATLYPQRTRNGEIYRLAVVDGATIKRVIDAMGFTPEPPAVAYQQIIKGVAAKDLTRDELIYMPRNLRPHKIYGFSPVEQVILLVNLAIRRTIFQLNYYTEGNIPEGIGFLPKEWTSSQIVQFDTWFQSVTNGDLAARRRIQWIPETSHPVQFSKSGPIFDAADEFLARVICFAFSLPPTAFVHQMNRATAEQAQNTAEEEGEVPILNWVKDEMNAIIQSPVFFNQPEVEFVWIDQPDVDGLKQAQIDEIYVRNGIRTVNEIRERDGLEPLTVTG
jgi:hypothetical protein